MPLDRRVLLTRSTALLAGGAAAMATLTRPAAAQAPAAADNPRLSERSMGQASAPMVVQEFFSLTCSHCGAFGRDTWPQVKRELVQTGVMHNTLRMLWGKKILEWSPSPRAALATLIELNNTYALDGRDPSSYSGIFWCLGRYDRPWAPERAIFGRVRFMSSAAALKKLRMKRYLLRFGPAPGQAPGG